MDDKRFWDILAVACPHPAGPDFEIKVVHGDRRPELFAELSEHYRNWSFHPLWSQPFTPVPAKPLTR